MNFRLVDGGWAKELDNALDADRSTVSIVCPFIKNATAARLLARGAPDTLRVITRYNLYDFYSGVSDIDALRYLLQRGARIRGVRNLHAKLYLIGPRVIVTSANLTEAALLRNREFGFVADDAGIVGRCNQYFHDLWERAGTDLTIGRLTEWEQKVTDCWARWGPAVPDFNLGDEGADTGRPDYPIVLPPVAGGPGQAFVKFFGEGSNRAHSSMPVLDEVQRSGCHWACTYPKGKRPRQVSDGAVMFMGRLVSQPDDVLVYGRAIAIRHVPERDDASPGEIKLRRWKVKWPHYVRVHHAEFVAGTLENGVRLSGLMHELGSNAFESTRRNAERGVGNTNPRRAYMRQAAVELSPQAAEWLTARLDAAFATFGKLPPAKLKDLDWPKVVEPPL